MSRVAKKEQYDRRLCGYLEKYTEAFLVHADNVGSRLFQDIRRALRPKSVIMMGKNTMMKRSIRLYCERTGDDKWLALVPLLVGNVGIVFTEGNLYDVRDEIKKYTVGAPAKVGAVAPCSVTIPAGPTGMDPSQTTFFQMLNIPTKINKGSIEILQDFKCVVEGDRVGSSEATLLGKLGIKPFTYGLVIQQVFQDGTLYSPKVLDITDDDLVKSIATGVQNVAALSMQTSYPTLVAVPHAIINSYKNVLAVALATDYSFPLADKVKEILANPGAFVAAVPAAAAASEPAAAAPVEEEEEEEEMDFDLFD
mmetsp:Transcript_3092/g.19039  ORF Transcript_3092/g.19039 Transcript_3092/m.19039 type:complete len:309 (+) Transcript_3092:354-1280(+)|eukprot:CAMPEP_0113921196 /NCGR_PEP_ID=MMETSP1159-20121227/955_1 /TAXON_ID=88271 /ORGANISM="Picocystis salinarum" /LENGTH=308 /DNA_ID=CAMNT_0000921231 /DNA_START=251 /DNA_END=1177 /DNA_ORIENTATION=+ /assembly_acc=CAM_ASM_000767